MDLAAFSILKKLSIFPQSKDLIVIKYSHLQGFPLPLVYRSPWDSHLWFSRVLVQIVRVPYKSTTLFIMIIKDN